ASSRRVCSSGLTSSQYFKRMIPSSTMAFSTPGSSEESVWPLPRYRTPLPARPGTVVPAAVENHDLARRGQMRNVALSIHLRLLPLGRCGKRDHPEHPRAYPLGHRLDRAALAGAVASLKEDANLQTLVHHPLLELDKLDV